ncbi:MAG: DUF1702 family protein [Planctomycetes bacterium]|nr:DUF1702 family protein [Planctomycetota bacterium]
MSGPIRWLLRRVLTLPPDEASGAERGFAECAPELRLRLDGIGRTVVEGHHAALAARDPDELAETLERVSREQRGFAFEGAAMGLALMDWMTCRGLRRWRAFRERHALQHDYMIHVGAGLACARLRRGLELPLGEADPLLGALVADGYGFHDGFFAAEATLKAARAPQRVMGAAARAYDCGLGRSLWFVRSASPDGIAATITRLAPARQRDLWSGVGLACAYAGGLEHGDIARLKQLAGPHAPDLAQGAAFAAEARVRANTAPEHTRSACEVLCGCDEVAAAAAARAAREDLPAATDGSAFIEWRVRLREHFVPEVVAS